MLDLNKKAFNSYKFKIRFDYRKMYVADSLALSESWAYKTDVWDSFFLWGGCCLGFCCLAELMYRRQNKPWLADHC